MRTGRLYIAIILLLSGITSGQSAAGDDGDLNLSAQQFLSNFWTSWNGENQTAIPYMDRVFSDPINFYGKSISHKDFMKIEGAFANRWPVRHYAIAPGSLSITCDEQSSACKTTGIVNWSAKSYARSAVSIGSASFSLDLLIRSTNGAVSTVVTGESGSVISRQMGTLPPIVAPVQQNTPPASSPSLTNSNASPSLLYQGQANQSSEEQPQNSSPVSNSQNNTGFLAEAAGVLGMSVGVLIFLVLFFYFLPTAISILRRGSMTGIVILLNLFLGWTFLGWLAALLIALLSQSRGQLKLEKAQLDRLGR